MPMPYKLEKRPKKIVGSDMNDLVYLDEDQIRCWIKLGYEVRECLT